MAKEKKKKVIWSGAVLRWEVSEVETKENHWLIHVKNTSGMGGRFKFDSIYWGSHEKAKWTYKLRYVSDDFAEGGGEVILRFNLNKDGLPYSDDLRLNFRRMGLRGYDRVAADVIDVTAHLPALKGEE